MANATQKIIAEEKQIIFRNFAGSQTKFNAEGQRNFCLVLDQDEAAQYASDGWNVKVREPREEDGDPTFYLKVKVKFDGDYPPKIIMVKKIGEDEEGNVSYSKVPITVGEVSLLDVVDIIHVDVDINSYAYDINGKEGITAYLNKMYVLVETDSFEEKYS